MGCNICGRGACASWMHSAEEQQAWESVEGLSERELKSEVISLRGEVRDLKAEIDKMAEAVKEDKPTFQTPEGK